MRFKGKWGVPIKKPSDVEKAWGPGDGCLSKAPFYSKRLLSSECQEHISTGLGTQAALLVGDETILRFFGTILWLSVQCVSPVGPITDLKCC